MALRILQFYCSTNKFYMSDIKKKLRVYISQQTHCQIGINQYIFVENMLILIHVHPFIYLANALRYIIIYSTVLTRSKYD